MKKPADMMGAAAVAFLRGGIAFYRYTFSALLGRHCRFLPTCSDYADQALRIHGAARGSQLAFRRFCRCHPWGGHGFDPVPEKHSGAGIRHSGTNNL